MRLGVTPKSRAFAQFPRVALSADEIGGGSRVPAARRFLKVNPACPRKGQAASPVISGPSR